MQLTRDWFLRKIIEFLLVFLNIKKKIIKNNVREGGVLCENFSGTKKKGGIVLSEVVP